MHSHRLFLRPILLVLSVVSLAVATTGCQSSTVQPWERGVFTEYGMKADRDPLATMAAEHTYFSREAAHGGRGVGGSGCGCN